jgi:c-di-GMP-binding flagellar brake protein YcgR
VTGIKEIVNTIQDSANVLVDIPMKTNTHKRLNSIYIKTEPPGFKLIFPPNSLPQTDEIDHQGTCKLSINKQDSEVILAANIDQIEGDRTLHLIAREPLKAEVLREYFRVTIRSPIHAHYENERKEVAPHTSDLNGETVDLSGGGVLALLPQNPLNKNNILLEIILPDNSGPVEILAHVVRVQRLKKTKYQVAFQFDKVDAKTQDRIIACCMQQQRKQLRDKIRVD